jgi:hypothetical protein
MAPAGNAGHKNQAQKNAASPEGNGVFDHDIERGITLSLAGLAATYSPRA